MFYELISNLSFLRPYLRTFLFCTIAMESLNYYYFLIDFLRNILQFGGCHLI